MSKIEAVSKLQAVFSNEPEFKVVAGHFSDQQGDASGLQKALFHYEVSPDKRSYEMGTIVQNLATVNAVADAVFQGEPLISRVTTLNGDVSHPEEFAGKNWHTRGRHPRPKQRRQKRSPLRSYRRCHEPATPSQPLNHP